MQRWLDDDLIYSIALGWSGYWRACLSFNLSLAAILELAAKQRQESLIARWHWNELDY